MNYQVLAVDMDGTLLNSQKEITQENVQAIRDALARGKTVVFSTGRCLSELAQYFPLFPQMRYVLCESGACVYDLAEHRAVYQKNFGREAARQLLAHTDGRDIVIQMLVQGSMYLVLDDPAKLYDILCHCHMERYYTHFRNTMQSVPDYRVPLDAHDWQVSKINLYFHTEEACRESFQAISALPITVARGEYLALECSPEGIGKGSGLRQLCALLHIPLGQTIAVGDSWNDEDVLRCAGLPVAMGNAEDGIKRLCRAVVADCDHSGVAEAIRRFL